MTERWPGEERLGSTSEQDLGPELDEDDLEVEPAEEQLPAAEAVPDEPEEQPDEEDENNRDTPVRAAEASAEGELPRLRPPEHAAGGLHIPDGYSVVTGTWDGSRRAVGIVVSRFNGDVTNRLLESALDELELAGVGRDAVTIMPVPGAFELPLAAMALAKSRRFACIVALGCVIRGETPHFDYVASEAASGLQLAALETGVPVAFGLLTLESQKQAEERIGKGAEAVRSALEMADIFSQLRASARA